MLKEDSDTTIYRLKLMPKCVKFIWFKMKLN